MWVHGRFGDQNLTVMVGYGPTNTPTGQQKSIEFYEQVLQEIVIIRAKFGDSIIFMGDFNARVGINKLNTRRLN